LEFFRPGSGRKEMRKSEWVSEAGCEVE
jgi:hypothetical protein